MVFWSIEESDMAKDLQKTIMSFQDIMKWFSYLRVFCFLGFVVGGVGVFQKHTVNLGQQIWFSEFI